MINEDKQSILKTRDLAILLDLSPDVVNDMARRGHLKGFKSGNQWRFRRRDVERYIERTRKLGAPIVPHTSSPGGDTTVRTRSPPPLEFERSLCSWTMDRI